MIVVILVVTMICLVTMFVDVRYEGGELSVHIKEYGEVRLKRVRWGLAMGVGLGLMTMLTLAREAKLEGLDAEFAAASVRLEQLEKHKCKDRPAIDVSHLTSAEITQHSFSHGWHRGTGDMAAILNKHGGLSGEKRDDLNDLINTFSSRLKGGESFYEAHPAGADQCYNEDERHSK